MYHCKYKFNSGETCGIEGDLLCEEHRDLQCVTCKQRASFECQVMEVTCDKPVCWNHTFCYMHDGSIVPLSA